MSEFNCPNCGGPLATKLATSRMVDCGHCGTTVLLEDEVLRFAGERGVMHDVPSLFRLGEETRAGGFVLTPVGHARFTYGRGFWDEFWCETARGETLWASVDEGDIALEWPLEPDHWPRAPRRPGIGTVISLGGVSFVATESEQATCLAVRGEFPEVLFPGETHRFTNFANDRGEILSHEDWDGGEGWALGHWVDPFDVARSA